VKFFAESPVVRWAIVFALLFAVLLGAQAVGSASAPPGGVASTGRLLGQTSFAYLGGLRTFAAAVLWNRIDPQFHAYYHENLDKSYVVFLPTVHMVLALDPQFEQGYYVASFMLAKMGHLDQGIALAEQGLRALPNSGLLRSNYIQLLRAQNDVGNRAKMLQQAKLGLAPTARFANIDDEFEALGVFRSVFIEASDTATVNAIDKAQERLRGQGAQVGVERSGLATASAAGK
jgi:tetratricopeptide (TPR) repeat protein